MTAGPNNLDRLESHFGFGRNWRSYAEGVGEREIEAAVVSLQRLLPADALRGKSFLDIGCGSGLSMLAAQRLGAASIRGIDLDPDSVAAARSVLGRFAEPGTWQVEVASILEARPLDLGRFEVVHSWGVLHHTGRMWDALERAAALVAPGGLLAVALYRRTPFCPAWRVEKKLYSKAPESLQAAARALYRGAYFAGLRATGRKPADYLAAYHRERGMDWAHDVHDWMGGYPYESASPAEVRQRLEALGFRLRHLHPVSPPLAGLFGSACDEYLAERQA